MLGAANSGAKGLKAVAKYPAGTGGQLCVPRPVVSAAGLTAVRAPSRRQFKGEFACSSVSGSAASEGRHGQYQTGRCSGHMRYLDVDTRSAAAATRAHGRGREQMHSAWQPVVFQRLSGRAAGSLGSPRQKRAAISPAVGGLSELGWSMGMSLPSYSCIFTSTAVGICHVVAVTEAQSRGHHYRRSTSASQTAQMWFLKRCTMGSKYYLLKPSAGPSQRLRGLPGGRVALRPAPTASKSWTNGYRYIQ